MKRLSDEGFTLVEAVVTGVILAVVAGGVLAVISLLSHEITDSTIMSKLQTSYGVVSWQIGSSIQSAHYVFADTEHMNHFGSTPDTVTDIHCATSSGSDTVAYRIRSGLLEDSMSSAGWEIFKTGQDSVKVTSNGKFILPAGRTGATLNLQIRGGYKNLVDTVTFAGDFYQCRN